jgi:hypothetical protein
MTILLVLFSCAKVTAGALKAINGKILEIGFKSGVSAD